MLRAPGLMLVVMVVASCGITPRPVCDANTCANGCCDADGECQTGLETTACGRAASVCSVCFLGQICSVGFCLQSNSGGGSGGGGGAVTGGGGGAVTGGGGGAVTGGGGGTVTGGGGGAVTGGGGGAVTGGGGGAVTGGGGGAVTGGGGGTMTGGGTGSCGPAVPGNPPISRRCAIATLNECDGVTDSLLTTAGVPGSRLNGAQGNGFDDDCDGAVDEGCACPANGVTKDCYLVPATQVSAGNGLPVGWCSNNSKGSLDCAGGTAARWSGVCRGGLPPALTDSCAAGDYNCDGLASNNEVEGCACPTLVQCPSSTITLAPYPGVTALPLIDGSAWVDPVARARTTGWAWTVLGGDCDNVLPNPTFALYSSPNASTAGARRGARTAVRLDAAQTPARYVAQSGAPLIAMSAVNYGSGTTGGQVYPAFGLSGDYVIQGEFTLDGRTYACTQKVQVRAPGIRAELCWDTVGGDGASTGNDLDLHFARLQGTTCTTHGWNTTCMNNNSSLEDCYYSTASGCANANPVPNWGYASSATAACQGWSSKRTAPCTNPRLDRDNISCDRATTDPTANTFCGPENINLDNPLNNDSFVVGVNHYGNNAGTASAKPHVNLYCNGERVLSAGNNPATGQTQFPLLDTPGQDSTGDFWTVATIRANVVGGNLTACTVTPLPSRMASALRDGPGNPGNSLCVDHAYANKNFVETGTGQGLTMGALPVTAAQWCKH